MSIVGEGRRILNDLKNNKRISPRYHFIVTIIKFYILCFCTYHMIDITKIVYQHIKTDQDILEYGWVICETWACIIFWGHFVWHYAAILLQNYEYSGAYNCTEESLDNYKYINFKEKVMRAIIIALLEAARKIYHLYKKLVSHLPFKTSHHD